jgi:hypothetical protein
MTLMLYPPHKFAHHHLDIADGLMPYFHFAVIVLFRMRNSQNQESMLQDAVELGTVAAT